MKTTTITIHAENKKRGMSGPELVKALRQARDGDDITARITWRGRIKFVTITRIAPEKQSFPVAEIQGQN